MEKHSVSRLSYLFAHLHLLSSDLFSSDSFHLCFSTVHIVGSFTSKLPSINQILWEFPDNLAIRKMGSNEKIQRYYHAIKIINMRSTLHHEAMILRSCCDNCMQRSIFGGISWGYAGIVGDKTYLV